MAARAIRINGLKIEWRNDSDTATVARQGEIIGADSPDFAIRVNDDVLDYIDTNGQIRSLTGTDTGATAPNSTPSGSIRISGDSLQWVGDEPSIGDPKPIFQLQKLEYNEAPTEQPSGVTISSPVSVIQYPHDAEVDWTNTSAQWGVRVSWFEDGVNVENEELAAGSTNDVSDNTYWEQGDEIFVQVRYFNEFGEGPIASATTTA